MINIPLEQPPSTGNAALDEWLTRMMILIQGALASAPDFTPVGKVPEKIENGMVAYFDHNLFPGVVPPGPYMVVEGKWVALHLPDIIPRDTIPESRNGMIFYASVAIPPLITTPGFWGFEEGVWKALTL